MMEVINDGHKGKGDLILLLHKYCLVQVQYFLHCTYMVCIRHMLHAEVQDDLVPDVPLHDVQDVL